MTNGKKLLAVVGLAVLSLAVTPVLAGEFYVGGALGQASTDVPGATSGSGLTVDDSSTGYKVFGGYDVAKYFAVEGAYVDGGSVKMNDSSSFSSSIETSGFAFRAMGVLPLREKLHLFADLGMYKWNADATVSDGFTTASGSDDGTDPVYGIGMGWQVMPKGHLRVEIERYDVSAEGADLNTDMISVGFAYNF
ncbi:MAG TPA: outer membrane beta-barrel protein [Candidatus Polarisedimenticolaceae bacterium]|nr:outer membrane beta-barrel protein [Candidatus Polarisedimenticolaceae bacterium]